MAVVKRARKYCDEVVNPKLRATPAGRASLAEGLAYTRILLPGMQARLPEFDAAAHIASWQAAVEALDADDDDELRRITAELVQWNCAYQQALEIRECTATADERAAAPARKR